MIYIKKGSKGVVVASFKKLFFRTWHNQTRFFPIFSVFATPAPTWMYSIDLYVFLDIKQGVAGGRNAISNPLKF